MWGDVRRGAEHLPWRSVAPPTTRGGQLAQGFILPFQLLRVLLEDTALRRGYLRVACLQVVAILVLVGVFSDAGRELGRMTGATRRVEAHLEEAQADAEAEVRKLQGLVGSAAPVPSGGYLALAMVKRKAAEPGTELALADGRRVRVVALPRR